VIVRKDRSADDRKICVRAKEVVRILSNEVKQTLERALLYLHRRVLLGKHDTMLVVVNVGRVLHIPLLACMSGGDEAQSLARRSARVTLVALVLRAKQTLGVSALRKELCRSDSLGVLLGLGEIYGDIKLAVLALVLPLEVLCNTVGADVVACAAKSVEIVGRELGGNCVIRREGANDLARTGSENSHQLGVEQIAVDHAVVLKKSLLCRVVAKSGKDVKVYDISKTHSSNIIGEIWRVGKIVIFSPTYNNGIYLPVANLLHDMECLTVQNKVIALAQNGTWAPVSAKLMNEKLSTLKNVKIVDNVLTIKSALHASDEEALDVFVEAVTEA
jgi:hypothetical protein